MFHYPFLNSKEDFLEVSSSYLRPHSLNEHITIITFHLVFATCTANNTYPHVIFANKVTNGLGPMTLPADLSVGARKHRRVNRINSHNMGQLIS